MNGNHNWNLFTPQVVQEAMDSKRFFWGHGMRVVDSRIVERSLRGDFHLSVKQVPSALAVRQPGSASVSRNLALLASEGFPLDVSSQFLDLHRGSETGSDLHHVSASQISALQSLISSNVRYNEEHHGDPHLFSSVPPTPVEEEETLSDYSDQDDQSDPSITEPRERSGRLLYEDPFIANAAIVYTQETTGVVPSVKVWPGDVLRLTDKIPKRLLKHKHFEGMRNGGGIPFYDIRSIPGKIWVLSNKTYWGNALLRLTLSTATQESRWAHRLWKRIKHFIKGMHDPLWKSSDIVELYGSRDYKIRDSRARSLRFIQLLLTVDGLFQMKYLAYPEEVWDWSKFDLFCLGSIDLLLGDEFLDGEVSERALRYETVYAEIKRRRKVFKEETGLSRLNLETVVSVNPPGDIVGVLFRGLWTRYVREPDSIMKVMKLSVLSQTRGMGTPPPLVSLQSKVKFLKTVTVPVPDKPPGAIALVRGAMKNIISRLPEGPFSGLQTKAGIRAAASACYEKTRASGGSLEAISWIVCDGKLGRPCYIIDLESGELVRSQKLDDEFPGEYIFWRCLEETLALPPEELRKAFLVIASEPGKARAVTKGLVCVKVVLDVVNSVCSWPMHKAFPSSTSGMSKETHGWNFYTSFFGRMRDLVFRPRSEERVTGGDGTIEIDTVYHDVFVLSTDFETATDYSDHEVAREISVPWMLHCGIPSILRGVVIECCYKPRRIEFRANGVLASIGTCFNSEENLNYVMSCRGVLMGDPLTKIILHFTNICVREISKNIHNYEWLSSFCSNASSVIAELPQNGSALPEVERIII